MSNFFENQLYQLEDNFYRSLMPKHGHIDKYATIIKIELEKRNGYSSTLKNPYYEIFINVQSYSKLKESLTVFDVQDTIRLNHHITGLLHNSLVNNGFILRKYNSPFRTLFNRISNTNDNLNYYDIAIDLSVARNIIKTYQLLKYFENDSNWDVEWITKWELKKVFNDNLDFMQQITSIELDEKSFVPFITSFENKINAALLK